MGSEPLWIQSKVSLLFSLESFPKAVYQSFHLSVESLFKCGGSVLVESIFGPNLKTRTLAWLWPKLNNKHLFTENIGKYRAIPQEMLHKNHTLLPLPAKSEKVKDALD